MSLLTRCPSCTTLYRVVPDQLRISQGWVKCGQCGEVFDASQHLIQASPAPEEASADLSDEMKLTPPVEDLSGTSIQSQVESPGVVDQSHDSSVLETDFEHGSEPVSELDPRPEILPDIPFDAGLNHRTDEEDNALPRKDASSTSGAEVMPDLLNFRPSDEMTADDEELERVSFLRGAVKKSFWHKPAVRAVLLLTVVILGLSLAAQLAFRERDRLAASKPELAPALEFMCGFLHCSVRAFEQIESLVIDSAGFKKSGADSYRLTFNLRNNSSLVLALPSIELTLTDSQDRAVVRRVLSPAELSAPYDRLAAGGEWPVTVAVRVRTEATAPTVLGYRLLVFYP